jgi:hypothetical protein
MPKIAIETPDYLKEIITNCWNKDPSQRKEIDQILETFKKNKKFEEKFEEFENFVDITEEDKNELELLSKNIENKIPNLKKINISDYKILKKIGNGSVAVCYKAVKCLKPIIQQDENEETKNDKTDEKGFKVRTIVDSDSEDDDDDDIAITPKKKESDVQKNYQNENEDKFVAIKLLKDDFNEKTFDDISFQRFLKEISIQLEFKNEKNIVKVVGYSIFKNTIGKAKLCIILEYVDGDDLATFLKLVNFFIFEIFFIYF